MYAQLFTLTVYQKLSSIHYYLGKASSEKPVENIRQPQVVPEHAHDSKKIFKIFQCVSIAGVSSYAFNLILQRLNIELVNGF
jgi:hypothetical protein